MHFRLELQIKPFAEKMNIRDRVMLVGSCFTQHISARLRDGGFRVMENPNGILFNPISITNAVRDWTICRQFGEKDIFLHNDLWQSWNHHGNFSNADPDSLLAEINSATGEAHSFLKEADWLIITLGSAFLYQLKSDDLGARDRVVANCHKVPAQYFNHRMASLQQVETSLLSIVNAVKQINPACRFIFTISPVRHAREGLVENNRSKGILHNAVHAVVQGQEHCSYFPAYELVIDDLRDYRFYAEDLVHPNYAATQYVWEKFSEACIEEESLGIMENVFALQRAYKHRPLHPATSAHQKFLQSSLDKAKKLQAEYTFLNLGMMIDYFSASIKGKDIH